MSPPIFPAVDRLGYSLNMAQVTGIDINSVDAALKKADRWIVIDFEKFHTVEIDNKLYNVPNMVSVAQDIRQVEGQFIHYANGDVANGAFNKDPTLSGRYFALTGPASVAAASHKSFLSDNQYAFFSLSKLKYTVTLKDYSSSIYTDGLLERVKDLPIFNGKDLAVVKKYNDFFIAHGSHVVMSVSYGARYPLTVWCSNKDQSVNEMFPTDVEAAFHGIPNGGQFDATVKNQTQYKKFENSRQHLVSALGGDEDIANRLANNSASFEEYEKWVGTARQHPCSLLSLNVVELWELMRLSKDAIVKSYSDQLSAAFDHIITRPKIFKTLVRLDIRAAYADFNLKTPSAYPIADRANPFPTGASISNTRIMWQSAHAEHAILYFFVINDGSPIDFSTYRGSMSHSVNVIMEGNQYFNNEGMTTKWFWAAKVNPYPETKGVKKIEEPTTWDKVLHDYLNANGEDSADLAEHSA
ncbi:hypothetical protein DEU56DRAFT_920290 [Suillus clintonianus]|uniref:uncharacterized protein n=1 Tax=Suillus clintonianus TaxID=1904413 RepID=UPI001B881A3C|nr:uncharacterized protein DEU56DRAFT_920290 [Suillus clintonianus]KAG2109751.1 hypothetical protein DEU56DRAFT_920290 [Suillus clintonianus]